MGGNATTSFQAGTGPKRACIFQPWKLLVIRILPGYRQHQDYAVTVLTFIGSAHAPICLFVGNPGSTTPAMYLDPGITFSADVLSRACGGLCRHFRGDIVGVWDSRYGVGQVMMRLEGFLL